MQRPCRRRTVLAWVGLVVPSGCLAPTAVDERRGETGTTDPEPTPSPSTSPTADARGTGSAADDRETESSPDSGTTRPSTTAPDPQGERRASPHEFVHVERVRDRSVVAAAPANETADFENLSRRRRRTFRAALERERVAAEGWRFHDESRPTFVRYDGAWFRVVVAVH